MTDRNVLGGELEPCGIDPVTGFYRDGCCRTAPRTWAATRSAPSSRRSSSTTSAASATTWSRPCRITIPRPTPGDRWCVTASNWLRAHEDGAAASVVLASTHERALDIVPLAALEQHAVDVPADPGMLGD